MHKRLQKMLDAGSIPHLLLFAGLDPSKESVALEFAKKLVSGDVKRESHPDIHHYHPEGKTGMHAILSMRQLAQELQLRPYESERHVFIIHDAERMLPSSSNALLKTFEEPPSQAVIILLASHPDKLLPTIVSRAQVVPFPSLSSFEISSLQTQMISILKKDGGFKDIEGLVKEIEDEKKEWEKEMRSKLSQDLTAFQRDVYEKEIEGASSLVYHERVSKILETILLWYRDLAVFHTGLESRFLYFPECLPELKQKKPLDLGVVEKAVKESRLAVERFIPLNTCLEALFLRLELV